MFQNFLLSSDVGRNLVSSGLATVAPFDHDLRANTAYVKYYEGLLKAERKAAKQRLGLWKEKPLNRDNNAFGISSGVWSKVKQWFGRRRDARKSE